MNFATKNTMYLVETSEHQNIVFTPITYPNRRLPLIYRNYGMVNIAYDGEYIHTNIGGYNYIDMEEFFVYTNCSSLVDVGYYEGFIIILLDTMKVYAINMDNRDISSMVNIGWYNKLVARFNSLIRIFNKDITIYTGSSSSNIFKSSEVDCVDITPLGMNVISILGYNCLYVLADNGVFLSKNRDNPGYHIVTTIYKAMNLHESYKILDVPGCMTKIYYSRRFFVMNLHAHNIEVNILDDGIMISKFLSDYGSYITSPEPVEIIRGDIIDIKYGPPLRGLLHHQLYILTSENCLYRLYYDAIVLSNINIKLISEDTIGITTVNHAIPGKWYCAMAIISTDNTIRVIEHDMMQHYNYKQLIDINERIVSIDGRKIQNCMRIKSAKSSV